MNGPLRQPPARLTRPTPAQLARPSNPITTPRDPFAELHNERTWQAEMAATLAGPHTLRTPDRTIAAGNVVLWLRAGWELRLEADRPVSELADIARTIRS